MTHVHKIIHLQPIVLVNLVGDFIVTEAGELLPVLFLFEGKGVCERKEEEARQKCGKRTSM